MGMVKHSQSLPNGKFTISWQYLKKEVRDEVDFLHESFLQVDFNTGHHSFLLGDAIIIDEYYQAFSKYSKQQVCNISTIFQKWIYRRSSFFAFW